MIDLIAPKNPQTFTHISYFYAYFNSNKSLRIFSAAQTQLCASLCRVDPALLRLFDTTPSPTHWSVVVSWLKNDILPGKTLWYSAVFSDFGYREIFKNQNFPWCYINNNDYTSVFNTPSFFGHNHVSMTSALWQIVTKILTIYSEFLDIIRSVFDGWTTATEISATHFFPLSNEKTFRIIFGKHIFSHQQFELSTGYICWKWRLRQI